MQFDLIPHPASEPGPLTAIGVRVHRASATRLTISASLSGDVERVRLPPAASPGRADDLWTRTCVELFVAGRDGGYHEFNFSPSGQWAAYRFGAYRARRTDAEPARITGFGHGVEPGLIGVHAEVDLAGLDGIDVSASLRIGVSAVVDDVDGRKTYWALAHPPGKPDFHHPVAFVGKVPEIVHW